MLLELSYLNEECFLSLNTDDKKYNISLKLAEQDLKDILGPEFYSEIVTQYDEETFTQDNDTLYENYIKDYLAWQTYFHYLKFSQSDSTPTGIRQFSDENSTVLEDVKLWAHEKNINSVVTRFKNQLINYLRIEQSKDSTKFQLWENKCKTEYSFGITSIDKRDDGLLKVNKAIVTND